MRQPNVRVRDSTDRYRRIGTKREVISECANRSWIDVWWPNSVIDTSRGDARLFASTRSTNYQDPWDECKEESNVGGG